MLTYLEVNLCYLLPPTVVLCLLLRPFISDFDKFKLVSLTGLAIVYTTLWSSFMVYHKAWWYCKRAVINTHAHVPIEEYLFFILQTIFTTLWTILCTRWTFHSLFLKRTSQFQVIRFGVIVVLALLMYVGWINAIPATKTFYMGSILCWNSLIFIILWYLSGPYVCKRWKVTLISNIVPSIYLCYVDVIIQRAHILSINEATSLGICPIESLPLEKIAFILSTNILIVFVSHTLDKSKAIIDTYYTEPFAIASNVSTRKRIFGYIKILCEYSLYNQQKYDSSVISDIETCLNVHTKRGKVLNLLFFRSGNFTNCAICRAII